MIKVGIIGGAGYTAGELIRLLLNHPEAEIVFINSSSNAGNKITDVHEPQPPGRAENHRSLYGLSHCFSGS